MRKNVNLALLSLLVLLGTVVWSCQKNEPIEAPTAQANSASLTKDWSVTLAKAEAFRAFVVASETFLSEDEAYYNSLSKEQQAARRAALQAAFDQKAQCPDPHRTAGQVAAYHASQAKRAARLQEEYPAFFKLPTEEQANALAKAESTVLQDLAPASREVRGCRSGYTACTLSGYQEGCGMVCVNACQAGYNACMGYIRVTD